MSEKDPMEFSPFDAPVKDVKPNQSNGIKIERITDSELDGGKKMATPPVDAPELISFTAVVTI